MVVLFSVRTRTPTHACTIPKGGELADCGYCFRGESHAKALHTHARTLPLLWTNMHIIYTCKLFIYNYSVLLGEKGSNLRFFSFSRFIFRERFNYLFKKKKCASACVCRYLTNTNAKASCKNLKKPTLKRIFISTHDRTHTSVQTT